MVIRKGCFHGYTSRRATSRAEGARPLNNQLNGRTVLDTGASSGLGVDFAREFAARREERLRGSGVSCTVISPGVTRTEFLDVAGLSPTLHKRLFMMDSDRIAGAAIRAMLHR